MSVPDAAVGPVLVDELKKQAREAGYVAWAIPKADFDLYLVYALGIVLGFLIASRT